MAQPNTTQLPCNEADILLAISAIKQGHIPTIKQAAALYNVPRTTLSNQYASKPARRDYYSTTKKLTPLKEEVIIKHILNLNAREFPPSLNNVQYIANKLLAKRSARAVGKN